MIRLSHIGITVRSRVVWSRQIAAPTNSAVRQSANRLVVANRRSNKFGSSAIGKSFGRGKLPLQHRKSWQVATPTNSANRQIVWSRQIAAPTLVIASLVIGHCRSLVIGTLVIASGWVG
jgi:hypothetical protein